MVGSITASKNSFSVNMACEYSFETNLKKRNYPFKFPNQPPSPTYVRFKTMSPQPICELVWCVIEGPPWPKAKFTPKMQDMARLMEAKGWLEHISVCTVSRTSLTIWSLVFHLQDVRVSAVIWTPCEVCRAGIIENVYGPLFLKLCINLDFLALATSWWWKMVASDKHPNNDKSSSIKASVWVYRLDSWYDMAEISYIGALVNIPHKWWEHGHIICLNANIFA